MSRSYRKTPVIKSSKHKGKSADKRLAAKTVRARTRTAVEQLLGAGIAEMKYSYFQGKMDFLEARNLPGDGRHYSRWYDRCKIYSQWCRWTFEGALRSYSNRMLLTPGGRIRFEKVAGVVEGVASMRWRILYARESWRDYDEDAKRELYKKWCREMYWK